MNPAAARVLVPALAAAGLSACQDDRAEPPTWSGDIAALVHANCAPCHRPGEAAPFPLLTYKDARKRARQIGEVTASRYMPPWLPEEGHFVGDRRLAPHQIDLIARWVEAGAPQGDPAAEPEPPDFPLGWQLGEPDLVVAMPEPFVLPASGRDVYHNIVLPDVTDRARFVKAVEFDPGESLAVHHAFVLVDPTTHSATLDAGTPEPGFPGMDAGTGAESPDGHFVSWQPGKVPHPAPDGMAWRLPAGADLVLQLHMRPTGKPEPVRAKVGIHFTNNPPTRHATKLVLTTKDIDIPPGDAAHTVGVRYQTPVDIDVLGLVPHAHYLGDKLHAYATLPDGTRRWIIRIDDWDFDWQGDYQFVDPLRLPAGSLLHQEFTYDNSAGNPANPNDPPRRVTYGTQSTDEMAELWLQVTTPDPDDLVILRQDFTRHMMRRRLAELEGALAGGTISPRGRVDLARLLITTRQPRRARDLLAEAARDDPSSGEPHYLTGMIDAQTGNPDAAAHHFARAVRNDPSHAAAHNALGNLALRDGDPNAALTHYLNAAQANPAEPTAHANAGLALLKLGRHTDAIPHLERSLVLRPGHEPTTTNLERARAAAGQ